MSDLEVIGHWIDGKRQTGRADRLGDVFNPAAGEIQARVSYASADEVDAAVASARTAFESWRHSSLTPRARILFEYREILEQRKSELARLITAEHGKVVSDALGEVSRGQEVVEFACGIPHLLKGDFPENVSRSVPTEVVDDSTWRGEMAVKLGPIRLLFAGEVHLEEMDEDAGRVRMVARGQETRGKGNAQANVISILRPADEGTRFRSRPTSVCPDPWLSTDEE